jgi:hypothetical protein
MVSKQDKTWKCFDNILFWKRFSSKILKPLNISQINEWFQIGAALEHVYTIFHDENRLKEKHSKFSHKIETMKWNQQGAELGMLMEWFIFELFYIKMLISTWK